jgi:hypothetical protein
MNIVNVQYSENDPPIGTFWQIDASSSLANPPCFITCLHPSAAKHYLANSIYYHEHDNPADIDSFGMPHVLVGVDGLANSK